LNNVEKHLPQILPLEYICGGVLFEGFFRELELLDPTNVCLGKSGGTGVRVAQIANKVQKVYVSTRRSGEH
jgi:hypothetical protein